MKKKYTYPFLFEGRAFCDQDSMELLLKELRGKHLHEQLHHTGIRIIAVDNTDVDYGYLQTLFAPCGRKFFMEIPGLREYDFPRKEKNFVVGLNIKRHRRSKVKYRDLSEMCRTLGHEMAHTWQYETRNQPICGQKLVGRLSAKMCHDGDEDFCNEFADAWLGQGTNYKDAKEFLNLFRRHEEFARVFPSKIMTFTH